MNDSYSINYEQHVRNAADYIRSKLGTSRPEIGLTLGSGLGGLAARIENSLKIPYSEIPNFPKTTVFGHEGMLYIGELEGVPVVGLSGRKHYYEVSPEPTGMLQVSFPVNVLAELGVPHYFATNAVGGLNAGCSTGDLMIITSHLSHNVPNALGGRHLDFKRVNDGERVWRFPPMHDAYNKDLRRLLYDEQTDSDSHIFEGTYIMVPGPTYETIAESLLFRDTFHADAVGMSVVPEIQAARSRGMNSVAVSCITNVIAPDGTNATNHDEVTATLKRPEVKARFENLVSRFFRRYRESTARPSISSGL